MHYSKLEARAAIPRPIKSVNQSGNKGDAHGVFLCCVAIFKHSTQRGLPIVAYRECRFLDKQKFGG